MKFSLRHDTALPADELFGAISDFPRMERMLVRRGIGVRRIDPALEPGAGMAWDMVYDHRGARREVRLDVVQFDRPDRIALAGQSDSLEIAIDMTAIALTRAKSRVIFELNVRPRNGRARLMLQTAKLGKAQLDRRFADRVGKFLTDLTERRG